MRLARASRLEGRPARDKLKSKDTHAPDIHTIAILLFTRLHHLRRQVVECTAHGLSAIGGGVHAPTEVSQLDHTEAVE